MATLTDVAYYLRKSVIFGSVGFVLIMVGTLSLIAARQRYQASLPIPTPTPSATFGTLPAIRFPQSAARPPSFKLELIEGRPSEGTPSASVYLVPDKKATLFSKRQGVTFGKRLNFLEEPVETSETILDFYDQESGDTLNLNIATNNFVLTRGTIDTGKLQVPTETSQAEVVESARGYFTELRVWHPTLTSQKISYYTHDGQALHKLPNDRGAQLVRVDFFRPLLGAYPVVTPQTDTSGVYVTMTSHSRKASYVYESSYQYFPVDESFTATYPTTTGQAAWETLIGGGGYIATPPSGDGNAVVRKVYLAYFQPLDYQPYTQLVWVFEGDGDFVAMVPAVDPSWVANN